MIDTPVITQTPAQKTAVIRLTVPRRQIREVMGPAMQEVRDVVAAQRLKVTGPMFSHHFRMDPLVFEFEVGLPVEGEVAPAGRVVAGELPARTVAQTVYAGPYDGLGKAWGEFDRWITNNGYAQGIDLWECYLEGSGEPRTELNRPVAK